MFTVEQAFMARRAGGISQGDVGKKLGMPQSHMSLLERALLRLEGDPRIYYVDAVRQCIEEKKAALDDEG